MGSHKIVLEKTRYRGIEICAEALPDHAGTVVPLARNFQRQVHVIRIRVVDLRCGWTLKDYSLRR